jgi:hypothetical protein
MPAGTDPNERGYGTGAATGVDYGGHDRPTINAPAGPPRDPSSSLRTGKTKGNMRLVMTGVREFDLALEAIAADDGPSSVNGALRKFIKEAVETIVAPKVRELIPYDDVGRGGFKDDGEHLEDQLVVKAMKRSRTRVGYYVGFPWPLFQGPTFYGGFLEFGWDHKGGFHVEADSFLRRALYPEADRIIGLVRERARAFIARINSGGAKKQ